LSTNQDETFPIVADLFSRNKIPVPKIIVNLKEEKILIVEDVGDVSLVKYVRENLGQKPILEVFKDAIDIIIAIQKIPNDGSLPFQRYIGENELYLEARRFIDFYAKPLGISDNETKNVEEELFKLSSLIAKHSKVLCHRDFMPWNIHIRGDSSLFVIDFQDAILGSPLHDLVSLLTDRDIDLDLGEPLIQSLKGYFFKSRPIADQELMFNQVLLHRHLRLAGQFSKLAQTKKSEFYASLVPGCIRRSKLVVDKVPGMNEISKVLAKL